MKTIVIVLIYALLITVINELCQGNLRCSFCNFFEKLIVAVISGIAMIFVIKYWVIDPIYEQFELTARRADHDLLTGICNRNRFAKEVERYNKCKSLGVVFVDINDLKKMNDTYGHDTGDSLIREVANAIRQIRSDCECMDYYRFGGDEFVMIFTNITDLELEKQVKGFLHNVENINLQASLMRVSVACGVAYEEEEIDLDRLLKKADERMYRNKKKIKKNQEK